MRAHVIIICFSNSGQHHLSSTANMHYCFESRDSGGSYKKKCVGNFEAICVKMHDKVDQNPSHDNS